MAATYLFFDIESAGCQDGEGHICSFGYVLCDSNFKVIESEDIVMNPRWTFDPSLFNGVAKCTLAYPQSYFEKQNDFSFFYERIKSLLLEKDRIVIGFAVENDVGFIACACKHFSLPQIDFKAYDIHAVADKANNSHNGLAGWMDFYKIDHSSLKAHRSCDDAMMTMLLTRKICAQQNTTVEKLFALHSYAQRSVRQYIRHRKEQTLRKILREKIGLLYFKRNPSPETARLHGRFKLVIDNNHSPDFIYDMHRLIYDNGGILIPKLSPHCTFISEHSRTRPDRLDCDKFHNVRFMTLGDLCTHLGLKSLPEDQALKISESPDSDEELSFS